MRPVLLGIIRNDESKEILDPTCGSGQRLVELIGRQAFDQFDRYNALEAHLIGREAIRRRATEVRHQMMGRTVAVLGNEAWNTLSLPVCSWLKSKTDLNLTGPPTTWWRIPHPSGRNSMYNDQKMRDKIKQVLIQILSEEREDV